MKYKRDERITKKIKKLMFSGRAILLYGPRQVGKTTLIEFILKDFNTKNNIKRLNFDDPDDRDLLRSKGKSFLMNLFNNYDIIFIDEIQKLAGIGNIIKLLVDEYKDSKQFILTGSSTVMIKDAINESMTGRKHVITLFPLSYSEIVELEGADYFQRNRDLQLIYGSYPGVQTSDSFAEKEDLLDEITDSYLYKDILEIQGIKDDAALRKLTRLIAFQIGSEVSINELSSSVGIARQTVENYLYLLEKNFIVFQLSSFSKNKRREVKKSKKIYFFDNGIRNAVVNDFRIPESRNDLPQLWENFIISERFKNNNYSRAKTSMYYWRTFDGAEVDLVEEKPGKLAGYEIKYSEKIAKPPSKWKNYSESSFETINLKNYHNYI